MTEMHYELRTRLLSEGSDVAKIKESIGSSAKVEVANETSYDNLIENANYNPPGLAKVVMGLQVQCRDRKFHSIALI